MTPAELDYCKKNIAVRIVEFNFRRDKITKSLEKPRNTAGYAKICLQNRHEKLENEIRALEIKAS